MSLANLLVSASSGGLQAAAWARLPGVPRLAERIVQQVNSAGVAVAGATALLSAASPLPADSEGLVNRHLGLLRLAAQELLQAPLDSIRQAGGQLAGQVGQLQRALGAVLPQWQLPGTALSLGWQAADSDSKVLAAGGHGFLLELSPEQGQPFRFELGKAAYDSLSRDTGFNIADQERLSRLPAQQAVAKGKDSLTLKGAIFVGHHGAGHLERLRELGAALQPLLLTTGFGEFLGRWYLTRVQEEQSHLFADGAPRKQTFTLELSRYGEDDQNV